LIAIIISRSSERRTAKSIRRPGFNFFWFYPLVRLNGLKSLLVPENIRVLVRSPSQLSLQRFCLKIFLPLQSLLLHDIASLILCVKGLRLESIGIPYCGRFDRICLSHNHSCEVLAHLCNSCFCHEFYLKINI